MFFKYKTSRCLVYCKSSSIFNKYTTVAPLKAEAEVIFLLIDCYDVICLAMHFRPVILTAGTMTSYINSC